MTPDELEHWLAAAEPPQREKLHALHARVPMIRALDDAAYARVIRAIKKRVSSPKLAGELATLLHELSHERATRPVESARAEPAPVAWVGSADLDDTAHALEAAIAADPEAQGPYTVLGDYLTSRGDVLGELIAIGQALAKNPTHKAMRAAWTAFFAAHRRRIYGEHAATIDRLIRDVDWYMGFIRGCTIGGDYRTDMLDLAATLLDEPGPARFIQRLALRTPADLAPVLARRPRPTLRSLSLGHYSGTIGDLGTLWPVAPGLRELRCEATRVELGDLRAPQLELFALELGPVEDGDQPIDFLAPLLAGDGVPKLCKLAITNCDRADELCEALARSPLAAQLVDIDLSQGTMTAAGAAALHAHRERFVRAERWSFELNYLTNDACAQLRELRGVMNVGDQRVDNGHRHGANWE